MSNINLNNVLDFIESLGINIDKVNHSGKHTKIYVNFKGQKKLFVSSRTPSDRKAYLNFQSDVKKWLRSTGGTV